MILGSDGKPVDRKITILGREVNMPAAEADAREQLVVDGVVCTRCRAQHAVAPTAELKSMPCPACGSTSLAKIPDARGLLNQGALLWALAYEVARLREEVEDLRRGAPDVLR